MKKPLSILPIVTGAALVAAALMAGGSAVAVGDHEVIVISGLDGSAGTSAQLVIDSGNLSASEEVKAAAEARRLFGADVHVDVVPRSEAPDASMVPRARAVLPTISCAQGSRTFQDAKCGRMFRMAAAATPSTGG